MGVSKRKAEENRHAIIEASEKLFRAHGVEGVGLTALMKAAGFTQGGFYNHFQSKDSLAAEVVRSAMSKAFCAATTCSWASRTSRLATFYRT